MRAEAEDGELVEGINVTPMVDITLVLLIIFMVTASFVSSGALKVALPQASTTEAASTSSLTVTLDAHGTLFLMKSSIAEGALAAALKREATRNPGVHVTLAADRTIPYGRVVRVLDLIKAAGIAKVALASER